MQGQVGVDHAHASHGREVETARDELRADQDVRSALGERLPDLKVSVGPARDVAIEAKDPSTRPDPFDHALETLCAHP